MDNKGDQLPSGILRAHQLRLRHRRLLRAFADQKPELFTAKDATDAHWAAMNK